ncbi:hypothetical protein FHS39_002538 [Streptomyces olivoverticillatus]|uniref:RanBP2-type domain-containing protein n=1 Tax=Streptomyces olivoverticillatus TaxID=66427 RepID=A0A7W7PKR5_9ACTN|nr:hypothetical protein [Streptomyces olivoverticillatus]MBB4893507.1 hypothetical protein [Streptomyces olivoverticillatus]
MTDSAQHPNASSPADIWGDWPPTAPPVDEYWICEFCDAENPSCHPLVCGFCHIRRDA